MLNVGQPIYFLSELLVLHHCSTPRIHRRGFIALLLLLILFFIKFIVVFHIFIVTYYCCYPFLHRSV